MITVDSESFLAVVGAAAVAALIAGLVGPRLALPVVVIEILLGILIGPDLLGLADPDDFLDFFSSLGLGMLFFFAGYEIDFERVRGRPVQLAAVGWAMSLALAYGLGAALAAAGVVLSLVYTGSALATTAIGTLIPILRDAGDFRSRFSTYLLGAGALGEFGPIVLVTIALSTSNPLNQATLLVGFVALAVLTSVLAVRSVGRGWALFERTFESSGQLIIRIVVVLLFSLLTIASELGLEVLLGGFVAGLVTRLALRGREVSLFDSKITALGYGFLVPFFFITSGMQFDLDALVASPTALLKLPLFVGLFLVVRGVPALVLYRDVLDLRDRFALGLYSATALPLVVAITTIATETGHMRSSTASALVGAGIVSTLVFPMVGMRLRRDRTRDAPVAPA